MVPKGLATQTFIPPFPSNSYKLHFHITFNMDEQVAQFTSLYRTFFEGINIKEPYVEVTTMGKQLTCFDI